jgi:hypothetical protein
MKLKRSLGTFLIIVLLFSLVIGFGLPRDVKADSCYYEGYVVQVTQYGSSFGGFFLREKPIDAGMYGAPIGDGFMNNDYEYLMFNNLRSARQNNTKVRLRIMTPGACPAADLSLPGVTFTGGTLVAVEISASG